MIEIGREYGLRAIRVPAEPALPGGPAQTLGSRALRRWCAVLRRQARRAGMLTNDHILGLGWTGQMNVERIRAVLAHLPEGLTELYLHPATHKDSTLHRLMPRYAHAAELHTLLATVLPPDIQLTSYSVEHARAQAQDIRRVV